MIFWLNRRVEQAIAAYLRGQVAGGVQVYRSSDLTPRQFPCAVVRAHSVARFGGEIYAAQRISAMVVVMTEFARAIDGNAQVIEEFEEIEEKAVSCVMEALFIDDLCEQLNAAGVEGISFSYAAIGDDSGRPVIAQLSEDGTLSMVEIPLVLHAGPTEG